LHLIVADPNTRMISGSATLTTVASMIADTVPSITVKTAHQR
jgi:hypothetical protein